MAWKPKTIFGKIVKGAVIGGGTILGLATGAGAIGGIVKGTGALAGIAKGVGSIKPIANTLKNSAMKLITGKTKEERQMINEQRELTRDEQHKLDLMEDLVNAGATPEEARAKLGIPESELTAFKGDEVKKSGMGDLFKSPVMLAAVGLLLLFFVLPKKR